MIGVHVAHFAGDRGHAEAMMRGGTPVAPALAFAPAATHFPGKYHLAAALCAEWAFLWCVGFLALAHLYILPVPLTFDSIVISLSLSLLALMYFFFPSLFPFSHCFF